MAQQGRPAERFDLQPSLSSFVGALFSGHHDHAGLAAGRAFRLAIRAAGEVRRLLPRLLPASSASSKEPPFKTIASMAIGFALRVRSASMPSPGSCPPDL
jgi:hypothetical protein